VTLYLIRHAHAVGAGEDPLRPLSSRGRSQVAQLTRFLQAGRQLHPSVFWHSPLARSRETAVLLAKGLGFAGPLVEIAGLEPEDEPRATASLLASAPDGLAIVGHEPHLSALATLLLRAGGGVPVVSLKKGSFLALEQDGGAWQIRWLIEPELLGTASG